MSKLGIVDDEQWANELKNVVPDIVVEPHSADRARGRGLGNVEIPEEIRKIIGEESVINGRQAALDLASDFGISASSVSAYAKGATSTASYNKPEDTLTKYLTARKNRINKKSLRVLQTALDQITPDKLISLKARDCAAIAKDMAVVSKNMEPQSSNDSGAARRPQFIIYAPQIRDERSFDTIVVQDNF